LATSSSATLDKVLSTSPASCAAARNRRGALAFWVGKLLISDRRHQNRMRKDMP
jgi:hypothetical protein